MNFLIATIISLISFSTTYAANLCNNWQGVSARNQLTRSLDEASGLTASRIKKQTLIWSNDSGGASALFATDLKGNLIKTVRLSGFNNTDYEALEIGACPSHISERSCIYVGDIGDGIGWRSNFKIGIFKESDFWSSTRISPQSVINYTYPRGAGLNAEAMVIHPKAGLIILSKNKSGISRIFNIAFNEMKPGSSNLTVKEIGRFDFRTLLKGKGRKKARVTDASLTRDGSKLLLTTYMQTLEVKIDLMARPLRSVKTWQSGIDYKIINSPRLEQAETISYLSNEESFILSSETPNGGQAPVLQFNCAAK